MAIKTDYDLWSSGWVVEGEDEWELLPGAPPDAVKVFEQINSYCTEDDDVKSWPEDCIVIIKEDKSIPEKNEEEKTAPEKNEEEKTAAKLFGFENKEQ